MIRRLGANLGLAIVAAALALPGLARASNCYAFVEGVPGVRYAALGPLAQGAEEVVITFVGHSTFRIETPGGVVIATDFYGAGGPGRLPDAVTMNKAHETHYTNYPDPAIPHVLRGWNPAGGPAEHLVELDDVVIRNVTTDIRGWAAPEKDGNSIFVFEVADLCIGHLGHLHHELDEPHYALLGVLDIVMAPVDGSYTVDIATMIRVLQRLKARLVLPMHIFGEYSLARFLDGMKGDFEVTMHGERTIRVSRDSLPSRPTVMVLPQRFLLE
ncbi:MAG TPA: MBL fold metallo-hydrolase [Thermohalobaculum sp.]|nr:MBL fold metallo-hydrolase [Thermohalobaculum sp.]